MNGAHSVASGGSRRMAIRGSRRAAGFVPLLVGMSLLSSAVFLAAVGGDRRDRTDEPRGPTMAEAAAFDSVSARPTEGTARGGPCGSDADCVDSLFCNGVEWCLIPPGVCQPGSDPCDGGPCDELNDVCGGCVEGAPCGTQEECAPGACIGGFCTCKCSPAMDDDCFTTVCDGQTFVDFGSGPLAGAIPADYFYPGSPPFSGKVELGGPGGFPGDTIVRRLEQVCFTTGTYPEVVGPIQVEVVSLVLNSCAPIGVGGFLYDMQVRLVPAPGPASLGDMTIEKRDANGGVFTSNLHVEAEITFIPLGAAPPVQGGPIPAPVDLTMPAPAPWIQSPPPWSCGHGFHPGWVMHPVVGPCCKPTCHLNPANPAHPHCVYPPDCPPCPDPHKTVGTGTGGRGIPSTYANFGAPDTPAIPADFFEPGSDPFTGIVPLDGGGGTSSDALVQRSGPADCPGSVLPRVCDPVQIEIVALSLTSIDPITVDFESGDTSQWDVEVELSPTPAPQGQMTITKTHENGGTFSSSFDVMPYFTFTKVSGPGVPLGEVRVLDYGTDPGMEALTLGFDGVPWVHQLGPDLDVRAPSDGNFVPGVDEVTPGDSSSQVAVDATGTSQNGGVGHTVRPPPPPPPPPPPDPHRTADPTNVNFGSQDVPAVPADFFGPGSDPFIGTVQVQGGPTDTLVQRMSDANCPPLGACAPISVEIVELNLVSVGPITVTYGTSTEDWDLAIGLSGTGPGLGSLQATTTHANGGSYDARLPILPRLRFTKVSNPLDVRVLDFDNEGYPPIELNFFGVPWVINLGPLLQGNVDAPSDGNFVPGVDEVTHGDPNSQVVVDATGFSKGGGVDHTVRIPTYCPLPHDPANDPCSGLQQRDCQGSPNDLCEPLFIQVSSGGLDPIECACFEDVPVPVCGPIRITADGAGVFCQGDCIAPQIPPCQIWADDGSGPAATGKTGAPFTQFTPGTMLWCDCAPPCQSDADCDDGDPCTTDICLADGTCQNTPDCTSDADCDDGDSCTNDSCGADGCCYNTPVCTSDGDCDDGNACTADTCGADSCCYNTPECTTDGDCTDNDPCTADTCDANGCCVYTPECTTNGDCDDGSTCTTDTCDAVTQCCVYTPDCTSDADCDDGNACTSDTCDAATGCCDNVPECLTDADCDDGNACTFDACVAGCCQHDSDPTCEACCLFDGTCISAAPGDCACIYHGIPQGPGSACDTLVCPVKGIWTGLNVDIHQDNPGVVANDFHIEGIIESSRVPVVVDQVNDLFPNFSYSVWQGDPQCPTGSIFWCFDANWDGAAYPYCSVLHLGLVFEVVCHNVMIDLVGWWTVDGNPVGGLQTLGGTRAGAGDWPLLGFDVTDNIPDPIDPLGQNIRLKNGLSPVASRGTRGNFDVEILQMDLVSMSRVDLIEALGSHPLAELRRDGAQGGLPWERVGGVEPSPFVPISAADPVRMLPGDEITVLLMPGPGQSRGPLYRTEDPIEIPPGGFLIAKQLVKFMGNGGDPVRGGGGCLCDGDFDGDGDVDPDDLNALILCVDTGDCSGCGALCDVNCDGDVNQGDVGAVQCLMSGLPPDQCCVAGEEFRWFWELHGAHELPQPEACCFEDGSCLNMLPADCICQNGTPKGPGTVCIGDADMNGIDDACEMVCEPLLDGSACKQVDCPATSGCFGECIDGQYCDHPDCPIGPAPMCYLKNTKESIKMCGDCFGECIGGSYCDNTWDLGCCIGGVCQCYMEWTDISIQLCGDCFGECINGSYCDHPNPDCCIGGPGGCMCYLPTHPISIKMCSGPEMPEECEPKCVNYNAATGATTITHCECAGADECHVDLGSDAGGARTDHNPCTVVDNGTGTVNLPPAGCDYMSPDEVHQAMDDLGSSTTIVLAAIHKEFICRDACGTPGTNTPCVELGGVFGPNGEIECFDSTLELHVDFAGEGGALRGFPRTIMIPATSFVVHTGPRNPGDPVQDFPTEMVSLNAQLSGDPDFLSLSIAAGSDHGLPSPGHTTLTRLGSPGSDFAVDSFFDVHYQIDFEGDPDGVLAGLSGSTVGTIKMATGNQPSCVGDCPAGTICHEEQVVNPDGTIGICCTCEPEVTGACCVGDPPICVITTQVDCLNNGGTYAGDGTNCDDADLNGIADECEPDVCGPTTDGTACQPFTCPIAGEVCQPQCAEFNPLTGAVNVTVCECTGDECHVDVGAAGGRGVRDADSDPCVVVDDGSGTVTLPPIGCDYMSPEEVHQAIGNLPPGTTIELAAIHKEFWCNEQADGFPGCPPPGLCEEDGGGLGGKVDCFDSTLELHVTGNGPPLGGFNRTLFVPAQTQVHTGPRTPGDAVQDFDTEMVALSADLPPGDDDFCQLSVRVGSLFGLPPSTGHTRLTRLGPPGSDFAVDSFFDVEYTIDFQGCPGSVLEGFGGSTTGTIHMETGGVPECVGGCPPDEVCVRTETVDPVTGVMEICCNCEVPCEGACCYENPRSWVCRIMTETECDALSGTFLGCDTECPTGPKADHWGVEITHYTTPPKGCDGSGGRGIPECTPGLPVDAWTTDSIGNTCHQFDAGPTSPPIPADFFNPGSDPFGDEVCLEGVPLPEVDIPGVGLVDFGEADTLVQRFGDPFERCDQPSPTEVEVSASIIALSLASIDPITVTFNGGQNPEQWDVAVDLSSSGGPGLAGWIRATKTHCNGGTYQSMLPVRPRFTFTKVGDPGEVRVFDTGLEGLDPVLLFQPNPNDPQDPDPLWAGDLPDGEIWGSPLCTDFHPAMDGTGTQTDCMCPIEPPGPPTDPEHQVKNRYISVDPRMNPTEDTVLKVEVAEMRRCENAPTRSCMVDSDCDPVCDDVAGAPPYHTLKCPPADCSTTVPPSVCIDSGPCVDLAPAFDPPLAWVVQQPIQDPTGGCKKPGCPPYDPGEDNCCEDDDWMAYLGDTVPPLTGGYTSWAQVWADLPAGVLHITDCGIVPATTYAVYACNADNLDQCGPPLVISTAKFPVNARPTAFPLYGDICGGTFIPSPGVVEVIPPDGYVSVKDLLVENLTIINYGSYQQPQAHLTWA
ncbi:MAG: hypothetical protein ACYTFA_11840, partial [Planctomycetota bacterium]